jgi:hypothetical protein
MIYYVVAVLKEIFEQGRNYPWKRPASCLRCNHYKVWGHGFVMRYFEDFPSGLYLKCYRCPNCGCVITLRPDTHFSRIRSSKETIRSHLAHRLSEGCWPHSSLPRSCLRYWLNNLTRQTLARLTKRWSQGLMAAFDYLAARGFVPVRTI